MPIYRYECQDGHAQDVQHSIYDEPQLNCDNCRGDMVRVPQAPSVSFQGSGFYSTDKNSSKK